MLSRRFSSASCHAHTHIIKIHVIATQYRIRFSKLVNKTLLEKVSREFREWIHEDPDLKEDKLRMVRTLTAKNPKYKEMLHKARSYVGQALVAYSQGNPRATTVKPFGLKAARSTKKFRQLPSTILALTYAALYQIVRTDPTMLNKWIRKPRVNITSPWPRGMILRFINLQKVFEIHRWQVFNAYEEDGGEYMGDEEETEETDNTPVKDEGDEFEEDFE